MDTYISSSSDLNSLSSSIMPPTSTAVSEKNSISTENTSSNNTGSITGLQRHPKYPNLRPYIKGMSGNPSGRPKGSISINQVATKRLKKKNANKIVDTMIKGAENGDKDDRRDLLKCIGDLDESPKVNLTNINVDSELIESARKLFIENQNRDNNKQLPIIDVSPILIEDNSIITGSINNIKKIEYGSEYE